MNDNDIIQLFLDRNENAIKNTELQYKKYCITISNNILNDIVEAEECVNDAILTLWNTIPPNKPNSLMAYIGKITRHITLDKLRRKKAYKRSGDDVTLIFSELEECIADKCNIENEYEKQELIDTINKFLESVPKRQCNLFVCRYWYSYSVCEIAKHFNMSENNVSVTLNRLRKKLKQYLTERGFVI